MAEERRRKPRRMDRVIHMVYISLSSRILLNIEALNMTESVGNFVRHRRAPIVIPVQNGYQLKYVPVISGETLAHSYQEILARIADTVGLPVCNLCRQGILLKHTDKNVFKESGLKKPSNDKDPNEVEEIIVKGCTVEDVGGFLYTDAALKRTSRVSFGYMIPAIDSIRSSAAEAQFHVRYDPRARGEEARQMIYNIEAGSALYVLSSAIDLCSIGVSSLELSGNKPKPLVSNKERGKRIEASIKALEIMVTQQLFGAKKTRFNPQWRIMSLAILVSTPLPLNVVPAHNKEYIKETAIVTEQAIESLNTGEASIGEEAYLYYYTEEEVVKPEKQGIKVVEVSTPVEAFTKAREKALELLKKRCM